ncbi:MAG TPA: hypothetical protein VGV38_02405, partial [Pyrinomonadaceae bacterium]|nr:hypothetical protein [Pyrinomonadaceae bacterium]
MRFFLGHERAVFTNGRFGFDLRPGPAVLLAAALLLLAFVYFVYVRPRARLGRKPRLALISLRSALFLLLFLLLLKPVVVVPSVVPRSSSVAVLADDSRSMQMADGPAGQSRLDSVRATLFGGENSLVTRLGERFKTETYGFSGGLEGVSGGEALTGEGLSSDVGGAISEAARRSAGAPLTAIVLFSDGASNGATDLAAELRNLRARGLPVY